jgi:hypothetical protein
MSGKKQPAMTDGIKSLLGVNDETPSQEISAHDDKVSPSVESVETLAERQARQAQARDELRRTLQAGTPEYQAEVTLEELMLELAVAEDAKNAASKAIQDANAAYLRARDKVDQLKIKQASLNQIAEERVRVDFLRKQQERRMQEHEQMMAKREALHKSGLMSAAEVAKANPVPQSQLDINIAKQNEAKRRAAQR